LLLNGYPDAATTYRHEKQTGNRLRAPRTYAGMLERCTRLPCVRTTVLIPVAPTPAGMGSSQLTSTQRGLQRTAMGTHMHRVPQSSSCEAARKSLRRACTATSGNDPGWHRDAYHRRQRPQTALPHDDILKSVAHAVTPHAWSERRTVPVVSAGFFMGLHLLGAEHLKVQLGAAASTTVLQLVASS